MDAYIYGVCFLFVFLLHPRSPHSFSTNCLITLSTTTFHSHYSAPSRTLLPNQLKTNLQPSKCNSRSSPSLPPWLPLLPLESELISRYRCRFGILTISERTVTVYACPSSSISAAGYASSTVAAVGTVGSTGVVTSATPTGSPITYAGAGSMNGVSAFGLTVAGVVALVSCL